VVATDVGGVRELLRDGVEGRLVPAREPAFLGRALVELACRPGLRREMGARGSARAWRDFHVTAATRRLEATYARWLVDAGLAGAA
jgi:glycosyltransferase involved in cell wall biosynthesis